MLETVRDTRSSCSTDRVRRRGAHRARRALRELIERIERGEETGTRLRLVDREIGNFRAAMDWFEQTGEDGAALRLATGLYQYWYMRGLLREDGAASVGRSTVARATPPSGPWPCAPSRASTSCSATSTAPRTGTSRLAAGSAAGTPEPVMGCETVLGLAALGRGQLDELASTSRGAARSPGSSGSRPTS